MKTETKTVTGSLVASGIDKHVIDSTYERQAAWLAGLDRQIKRAKGSTKRQLQSLRAQQIQKHKALSVEQLVVESKKVSFPNVETSNAREIRIYNGRVHFVLWPAFKKGLVADTAMSVEIPRDAKTLKLYVDSWLIDAVIPISRDDNV